VSAVAPSAGRPRSSFLGGLWSAALALALWGIRPFYNRRFMLLPPVAGIAIMALIVGALLAASREVVEGDVQRLMYIHVPSIMTAYAAIGVTAVAAAGFLITRDLRWDSVARAAAGVVVLFTGLTLATGAIWGKPIWGVYWAWEARLIFTLVLFLIYLGYLLARSMGGPNDEQTARYASVVAILGVLDVPLVHFAVQWWRTLHPQQLLPVLQRPAMPGDMVVVLFLSMFAVLSLGAWLLALSSDTERLVQRADRMRARLDQREPA
jgi:heme exporter protein C